MILLEQEHYSKLNHHLDGIHFNHLFAKAVIDQTVSGRIYVDNISNPTTFYVVHRYGMSLLGGNYNNSKFNLAFKEYALNLQEKRDGYEWMQVFPAEWETALKNLFEGSLLNAKDNKENISKRVIELNTRVNFKFDKLKFLSGRRTMEDDHHVKIIENTTTAYDEMKGSVVPSSFWNSSQDFKSRGVSFGLYLEDQLAAVSFSSFIAPEKLELGIETTPEFRGNGFAEKICTALIDYCLERNLEPIWSCRLENTGSFLLAKKLGFDPTLELPYYRLSN
jgi:GNAT superfamily N-acetyltransferase